MDRLLGSKPSVPGFRFNPMDEELVMYYLKRKIMGKSLRPQMISEVQVYRFAPWDLPSQSFIQTKDLQWYFFCPRSKKYANGGRSNRAAEGGYWKSTGNDRVVNYNGRLVGKIKTLVFHKGKPPNGDRTDWVMHEYRMEDKLLLEKNIPIDAYVICKVFKKSGLGPKNGESHGAPFVEEDWESDDDGDSSIHPTIVDAPSIAHTEQPATSNVDCENVSVIMNTSNTVVDASTSSTTHQINGVCIPKIAESVAPCSPVPGQVAVPESQLPTCDTDELDGWLSMLTEDEPIFQDLGDIPGGYLELNDIA